MRVVAKTDGNHFELWVANKGEPVPETAMQSFLSRSSAARSATAETVLGWGCISLRRERKRTEEGSM